MGTWKRNEELHRWELGRYTLPDLPRDDPGGEWKWHGYVTDEYLASAALKRQAIAVAVFERFGSVPPPLEDILPNNGPWPLYGAEPLPDGMRVAYQQPAVSECAECGSDDWHATRLDDDRPDRWTGPITCENCGHQWPNPRQQAR